MPEHWQFPVLEPLFTDALAVELVEQARGARKPRAFDTRLRFSDAGRCARQIAYDALGVVPAAWDPASIHVAAVGTFYHELLQAAILRRYPGAEIEVKGRLPGLSNSGHADVRAPADAISAVVSNWGGGDVLYELKTKSTYQFDTACGVMRKGWKRGDPKGPGLEVILQAGLNAIANDCQTVVVGYVCFENYSVGLAEKVGLRQMDRFLAEWHIPVEVWRPLADDEIRRLETVLATIDADHLPERHAYDDAGDITILEPEAQKPPWQCQYCSFRTQCEADGPGIVEVFAE